MRGGWSSFSFFFTLILGLICLSVTSEMSSKFFENPLQNSTNKNKNQSKTTPRPFQDHPKTTPDTKMCPRRAPDVIFHSFGSFWASFGVPWGTLRGAFSVFWLPRELQNRKKRHIGECLFAGPMLHQIFLTFFVPWTPKNKDSV